mgnify:CR=1 FL=1
MQRGVIKAAFIGGFCQKLFPNLASGGFAHSSIMY